MVVISHPGIEQRSSTCRTTHCRKNALQASMSCKLLLRTVQLAEVHPEHSDYQLSPNHRHPFTSSGQASNSSMNDFFERSFRRGVYGIRQRIKVSRSPQ